MLVGELASLCVGWFICWLVGSFVGFLFGRLFDWWDSLVGWMVDWLLRYLTG